MSSRSGGGVALRWRLLWFGNQSGTGDQTVDDDGDNKRAKNHEEEDDAGDRAGRARVIRPPVIVIGQSAVTQ